MDEFKHIERAEKLKAELKTKIKHISNIVFWCIVTLVVAYGIQTKILVKDTQKVYSYNEISTALNERSELIITNRETGEYIMYSDSVALGIFNMMATKISSSFDKQLKKP